MLDFQALFDSRGARWQITLGMSIEKGPKEMHHITGAPTLFRIGIALLAAILSLSAMSGVRAQGVVVEIDLADKLGSTHELAVAPDGAIWVSQMLQHRLVRISPDDDSVRFFDMPPDTGPHGLKFDHGGQLWLTFQFTDEIVEIGPDGGILARHRIPSPGAGPHGLGIALDNSIWWTGKTGDMIGRFDPQTGATTIFPLGHVPATPIYIVADKAGSMWFTELEGSRLGRIDAEGKLAFFELPTTDARPIAVFPGPDAQIWFTEERGNAYGRVTHEGRVEEFPTGVPGGELASATFDAADNLWIQFNTPDIIQRIAPDGTRTTFPLSTRDAVQHRIIASPDGRIWFTELESDKVGYIVPD